MSTPQRLAEHYHQGLRDNAILSQIRSHYPDGPTLHQLAPLDQLHIGGIAASKKLLNLLDPSQHTKVLDIGSGLGGLMRQGAALGFQLTGLDITHRFNVLNQALTNLSASPANSSLNWVTGDACALPFPENTFDAVLFQHSLMNMPDPTRVIAESRRVLHPGGKLVMHEVVSGKNLAELRYPVPWAASPEHSHLLSMTEMSNLLAANGFQIQHSENWSSTALEWRQRQRRKEQTNTVAVLSPQWVFGERFLKMGKNLIENLSNNTINVVEISARC